MAEVFNSKYSCEEIEKILDTQALLAEFREAFTSDWLLENAGSCFKDTDEVKYSDVLQEAEIMDVANLGTNTYYSTRIRYIISKDYFLCQNGVRMQYTSACNGSRINRTTIDVVVPLSLPSGFPTLSEKYYFEVGGGQLVELYFVPDDGETLSELSLIEIRYDKGLSMQGAVCDIYVYKDGGQEAYVGAESLSSEAISDESGNIIGYKMYMLDLKTFNETTITEKGTYTLTIPEGAFLLGDEKIPNEETTLTYHIE